MAGFDLRKLANIGRVADLPQGVPDLGFGPMTDETRAGVEPGAFSASPSPEEKLRAIADMGAGPVLARGYKGAFDDATDKVATAINDPSALHIGSAAAKTGMLVGDAPLSLGGAGLAYGDALLKTLGPAIFPSADAKKQPKVTKEDQAQAPKTIDKAADIAADPVFEKVKDDPQLLALYKQIQQANTDATRDYPGRNGDQSRAQAAQRLSTLQGQLNDALTAREKQKQSNYDQQVVEAKAMRDKILGEDDSFKKTPIGKAYSEVGVAPLALGAGEGILTSFAKGAPKGLWSELASPMAVTAGVTGAGANIAPTIYNRKYAPEQNKTREAWEAYSTFLPDGHPDKQKAIDYARSLPQRNPVFDQATKDSDWGSLGRDAAQGAIEGYAGYGVGRIIPPAFGGLLRRNSYGFEPPPAAPALSDRIEPTLPGSPSLKAVQEAVSPPVTPLPTPKVRGTPTPGGALAANPKALDKALTKADKADRAAIIRQTMVVAPKGTKRSDVSALFDSGATNPADIIKALNAHAADVKSQPGSLLSALEDEFGKGGK